MAHIFIFQKRILQEPQRPGGHHQPTDRHVGKGERERACMCLSRWVVMEKVCKAPTQEDTVILFQESYVLIEEIIIGLNSKPVRLKPSHCP